MAITIKSTKDVRTNGVKCLVYGQAGSGKTRLCATAPSPIIISAESGLLSLREFDLPYIEVNSLSSLGDAYQWCVSSKEAHKYDTICIDSISEIAEVVLKDCLNGKSSDGKKVHGMQAYGKLKEVMIELVKDFRDLKGKNVYLSAKEEKVKEDDFGGSFVYRLLMPGTKLATEIPYLFDEVFQLETFLEEDKQTKTKTTESFLRTGMSFKHETKDRSGALDEWEFPDLTAIFEKIKNG